MLLCPTLFPVRTELTGPKHSTSVLFSAGVAVPLSVDVKEVALVVPNPVSGVALKSLLGPQVAVEVDIRGRVHRLRLPPTLQIVIPLIPLTLHVKEKVSPGQVGGGAANCPDTSPRKNKIFHLCTLMHTSHGIHDLGNDSQHVCMPN